MGKKTRTRRTKWRRLSLGEASGPEEEDDETQQPEDFPATATPADHALVLHSDDLSLDEQFAVSREDSSSSTNVVTVADVGGAVNCNTSGQEQEQSTDMMVSNHQVNHQPPQTQSRGPSWKLAANQGANAKPANNPAYYSNVNNGFAPAGRANAATAANGPTGSTANMSNPANGSAGFRRGANNGQARYNNGSYHNGYGNAGYGRANSWNSSAASSYNGDHHHHHHHHHHQPTGLSKMHGIEKKIFNDEEYTKISTPRQEVLFKKGSIGAKKRATPTTSTGTAASNDSGSEQDSVNGNAASPVSPAVGDEPFAYGNDSGSTGDASSTAGETQSPDASAVAAASGAALQSNYDGAPLVCFPMYDFYGGYSGMYPGSMLVQTYPGGPIVAAVPVPVPVQTIDWYRGAGGGAGGANGTNPAGGEVGYYYALGYPAGSEMPSQPETSSSSRRNSLESYQASSQEVTTGSEASENSSPCSTGPSSQGPASPQGELVSPAIDPKAQTGGGVATATAAAAVVMDMNIDNSRQQKMAVAGFVYPYPAYGLAPPALFASGSVCDPNSYFFDDCGQIIFYDQYDEEAMDLNGDVMPDEVCPGGEQAALDAEPETVTEWDEPAAVARQDEIVQPDLPAVGPDRVEEAKAAMASNPPAGTGRRKKRRKKRNKTRSERSSQPRVTDDGAAEDEEDEDEVAAAVEPEEKPVEKNKTTEMVDNTLSKAASPTPATDSPHDPSSQEVVVHPLHSSLEPTTLSSPLTGQLPELSETISELSNLSLASCVDPKDGQSVDFRTTKAPVVCPPLEKSQEEDVCLSLPESSAVLPDPPDIMLEHPVFCSTPSCAPESFALPAVLLTSSSSTAAATSDAPPPTPEQVESSPKLNEGEESTRANQDGIEACFQSSDYCTHSAKPSDPDALIESSTPVMVAEPTVPVQKSTASHLRHHVQDCQQQKPSDGVPVNAVCCPDAEESGQRPDSAHDSIEDDSLIETAAAESNNKEDIDRDSLDSSSSSDEFVYLQLDERDETTDVYFDDEPGGTIGQDHPPAAHHVPQLWRTVIMEESEPNSKEMSPILCSDSGIVAGTPSPPVSDSPAGQLGPITKAVSQWLESAPIQQQLIASSANMFEDETEDDEDGEEDDNDHHYQLRDDQEETDQLTTVPKNELATLRTAPSSDVVTEESLRRVVEGEEAVTVGEELLQPVTEHCDPAKYSVYYQLGVSVEQLDDVDCKVKGGGDDQGGNDSLLNDSDASKTALIKAVADETIEQCPLTTTAQCQAATTAEAKKRRKRNAWRRILLLHRAVHKSRRDPSIDNKTKRLKSGPTCCAIQ